MKTNRAWLFLAAVSLAGCAQAPPSGPQMMKPGVLHATKHLVRAPLGQPMGLLLEEKGKAPRRVQWNETVLAEVLDSSNFDLSEGMMLDFAEEAFHGSPCPAGNRYERTRTSAKIQTVDRGGTVQEIRVSAEKGGWVVKISQKSQARKYPQSEIIG